MSVIVKETSKLYGAQKALDNVGFEVGHGEIAGLIGPNGAGKSTLMKIITGFIPPSSGRVSVHGFDVAKQSLEARRYIGYLPESNALYPDMYIREYLEFVAGIYKLGKDTSRRVEEVVDLTGLGHESRKKIGQLSKGYKQRVGIAQALIHDPKVLILDEPTSGLDPNQLVEIRNLISQAGKEKTVILSTHIMQEVEAICDRIIIINKGKIVANDLKKNIYGHSATPAGTIIVEFNSPVEQRALEAIHGVEQVKELGPLNWLIQSTAGQDARGEIFNFAVSNNITVLSLQKKEKSLEEVFRELTG